jgi:hypothetical protein
MYKDLDAHYILTNDIDCSATNPANENNSGSAWDSNNSNSYGYNDKGFQPIDWQLNPVGEHPLNNFTGILEGGGHQIKNLYINRLDQDFVALIAFCNGCIVNDIGLENVNINARNQVAGLIGLAMDDATNPVEINNSYVNGRITGNHRVGGLLAIANNGVINNSYTDVRIDRNSVFLEDIWQGQASYFGGLMGASATSATITNSYAIGPISPNTSLTGGLIGGPWSDITTWVGTFTNSYWNTETTGQSTSWDDKGEGRTTAEMTHVFANNTYVNWDFDDSVWKNDSYYSDGDYPCLAWQEDSSCPFYVNPND